MKGNQQVEAKHIASWWHKVICGLHNSTAVTISQHYLLLPPEAIIYCYTNALLVSTDCKRIFWVFEVGMSTVTTQYLSMFYCSQVWQSSLLPSFSDVLWCQRATQVLGFGFEIFCFLLSARDRHYRAEKRKKGFFFLDNLIMMWMLFTEIEILAKRLSSEAERSSTWCIWSTK